MNLNYDDMSKMNDIQLDMFKEFVRICSELGLRYYMIHGSLLGAVRFQGFFPYDDDIDIAMPREDYDILLREGNSRLPSDMFLQSCKTEKRYPLPFAKIRNNNTAFIQPLMEKLNINQGIYIDIFPIDNYPKQRIKQKYFKLLEKLYGIRISCRLNYTSNQAIWKKVARALSVVFCPSWERAVNNRADLYKNIPENGTVITVGGKGVEKGIPWSWFGDGTKLPFVNLEACCPADYPAYLTCIYKDYAHYNPAEKYMNEDMTVTVSAEAFSLDRSYKKLKNSF